MSVPGNRDMAALKISNKRDKGSNESHAEAVDDANKTLLTFDKLPNEMLEKIFEQLIEIKNGEDPNANFKLVNNRSYLNCRLVNSRWKSVMERGLEKDAISIWKTKSTPISLMDMEAESPAMGYIYVLKPEDRGTPSEWAYLPPPLESIEEKVNPFPSRSLKLTSDFGDWTQLPSSRKPSRGTQLIWLISFFSKFGEHLTSLILTSVTLTPETFIGILGNTPNLKALNIMRVLFRGDLAKCAQLPALKKLQHVRVFKVMIIQKKEDTAWIDRFNDGSHGQNQLYDWILSPYKEQLLTLDIYGRVGIATATNFANLERLFVYRVDDLSFLQSSLFLYPKLKSLFLINAEIKFNRDILEWFQQHIEHLAPTLSELHLDLSRNWLEAHLFQLSKKLTHSQNKTDKVVFREMKTFAITFPQFPEEVEVIKTLIKGFPNLETLMLLDRDAGIRVAVGDAQNVFDRDEYIKVCPKLKKVMIQPLCLIVSMRTQ
ncbi:unnamed protein product [Orchesella dallaii]|uniref:F-box domain-containing protein n=1 Tax=Orchesella dallaii TaxID=48710 RepID=A0ABP1RJZ9_9HEXA